MNPLADLRRPRLSAALRRIGGALALALTADAQGGPLGGPAAEPPGMAAEPLVRHWTVSQGLPQMSVTAILQGQDRQLWMGTFGGLTSFDGTSFQTYDIASLPGLVSNRIIALSGDGGDGLWLATQAGHLMHFHQGTVLETIAPPAANLELVGMIRDQEGAFWLRERRGGLLRWVAGRWERLAPSDDLERDRRSWEWGGAIVRDLALAGDGEVWARFPGGLARYSRTGALLASLASPSPISWISPALDGQLWVGLFDGLARVSHGRIERIDVTSPLGGPVRAILAAAGQPLLVVVDAQLMALEPELAAAPLRLRVAWSVPLEDRHALRDLALDDEGNLWIGTDGGGLIRFSHSRLERPQSSNLRRSVVAMAPDGRGGALVAIACDGLVRLTAGGERVADLPPLPIESPAESCVTSLLRDRLGRTWIGAGRSLWRMDVDQRRIERTGIELVGGRAGPMAEDAQGIWASSENGVLLHLNDRGEVHEEIRLSAKVYCLRLAPDGDLWVGSRGAIYRLRQGRAEPLPGDLDLRQADVRDLLFEGPDRLWIGTYGRGLGYWNGSQAHWITTAEGLPDNSISRVLVDRERWIWTLTNSGLAVADRSRLLTTARGEANHGDFVVFGAEDGMPEGNFGSPAGFADPATDRLWFGTIDGPVRIDAAGFPFRQRVFPAAVRTALGDGETLALGDSIVVPPSVSRLEVRFRLPSFTAPERLRLRYRMRDVDVGWVEPLAPRAHYTNLPPGRHRLEVLARNEDGVWSTEPLVVPVEVVPSWTRRTALRVFAAIAAVVLLLLAHRLRVRAGERRANRLIAEVEARRAAEAETDDLRHRIEHVERISVAGELAAALAHEVRQPLSAITSAAGAAQLYLKSGPSHAAEVDSLLGEVINQSLRASAVLKGIREFLTRDEPQRAALDLSELASTLFPMLKRELVARGIESRLDLARHLPPVVADPVDLQQVLVNLILNACDALAGRPGLREVEIASFADPAGVHLRVRDSGPGVPPSVASRLFHSFVTSKPGSMGIGLAICRTLLARHGGKIELEPTATGASFLLTLPAANPGGPE